jgi:hypothetical protein
LDPFVRYTCAVRARRGRPTAAPREIDLTEPARRRPLRAEGWYRDPSLRFEARWWDGEGWTERVLDRGNEAWDLNPMGLTEPAAVRVRREQTAR